jgi:hypothetical protein
MTMSSNSALNRRSFLGRGAALAAVPAVASLAAEGLTGQASAGTLPDYAPIPKPVAIEVSACHLALVMLRTSSPGR